MQVPSPQGASAAPTVPATPAASSTPATVIVDVYGHAEPRLAHAQHPFIYVDDLAAVRGDGVFETLMLRKGTVAKQHLHRNRFLNSAAMLDLPEPDMTRWDKATELACQEFMRLYGGEAAVRWVYSRGRESTGEATGWITVNPISPAIVRARTHGVRVMSAERGYRIDLSERSPWALVGAKTLSYAANMAALRVAAGRKLDDVIFVSDEGHVLEGPTSTVVAVQGRTLITPPSDAGILPGTTQAALFTIAEQCGWETRTQPLSIPDLQNSDGVWLLSSVRVHARVTELDGVKMERPDSAEEIEAMAWEAVS